MSASRETANLGLPQYNENDKPTWLVDINGAFAKIDEFAGRTKTTGTSNTQAITNLQTQQNANTANITNNTNDIALIKSNQTAVNKHLTDIDTEINALDDRVTALEDGQTGEYYTKAESDAKYATIESVTAVSQTATAAQTAAERADNATVVNATAIENVNTQLTATDATTSEEVKFQFGITADGKYGYKKVGADTVTPFSTKLSYEMSLSPNTTADSDKMKLELKLNSGDKVAIKVNTNTTQTSNLLDGVYVDGKLLTIAQLAIGEQETTNGTFQITSSATTNNSANVAGILTITSDNPTKTVYRAQSSRNTEILLTEYTLTIN